MRYFDIVVSLLCLLLLCPLFICLSVLLRFTGEGEIFYFQERMGRNGAKFKVIKFATMLKNSPNMGSGTITSMNDDRILPVGSFLRKTKINELPQLFNVLWGQMSLIGPRPHAERDLAGVPEIELKQILAMRPGISGIGSLVFRNEEEILKQFEDPRNFYDDVVAPYKAKLEVWYGVNKTFRLNVVLCLLTVFIVVFGDNKILYRIFPTLPRIPNQLSRYL